MSQFLHRAPAQEFLLRSVVQGRAQGVLLCGSKFYIGRLRIFAKVWIT
jgi:hypothetical protein